MDAFKIGDKTERLSKTERETLLLAVLQEHLQTAPSAFITVVYVCYSQPSRQMHEQARAYVTATPYATELNYEEYVGSVYPDDCATAPAGTPWYDRT
jgi:hypothetical protein